MSSVVVPECFLTLTLYLSSDRPSLIPFNIESLIIMTSFLLSILEFLKDDCFDDILANDSDSNDDAFWCWLLFDDDLSDLFWLFKDNDWNCDLPWLFLVSSLFNLIGSFEIDETDVCPDFSENIEVSLLPVIWFGGVVKGNLYFEVCLHLQKSFPPKS